MKIVKFMRQRPSVGTVKSVCEREREKERDEVLSCSRWIL